MQVYIFQVEKLSSNIIFMGKVNNVLRALVCELFLEIFYEKMIKQLIFLQFFIFLIKMILKTFLIWLLTITLRTPFNMTVFL